MYTVMFNWRVTCVILVVTPVIQLQQSSFSTYIMHWGVYDWGTYIYLAPVVQKVDSAIHRINHYPVDSTVGFANAYPLDSDLSGG